jgi:predicted metalloprotease
VVVVLVVGTLLGVDPRELLRLVLVDSTAPARSSSAPAPTDTDASKDFVAAVLGSTEDTWSKRFTQGHSTYLAPQLVLFRDAIASACGQASSSTGPFYCPADRKVYLDLGFFDELARRFHAPGDFAQAYVVAHEVGHHVQTLTGTEQKLRHAEQGRSAAERNALSVRLELQADCYAGLWAHDAQATRPFLQAGDVEEALAAATAIGDDRLQKQARGTVRPETFTHGTSAQRVRWFKTGFEQGSLAACDTFAEGAP